MTEWPRKSAGVISELDTTGHRVAPFSLRPSRGGRLKGSHVGAYQPLLREGSLSCLHSLPATGSTPYFTNTCKWLNTLIFWL